MQSAERHIKTMQISWSSSNILPNVASIDESCLLQFLPSQLQNNGPLAPRLLLHSPVSHHILPYLRTPPPPFIYYFLSIYYWYVLMNSHFFPQWYIVHCCAYLFLFFWCSNLYILNYIKYQPCTFMQLTYIQLNSGL